MYGSLHPVTGTPQAPSIQDLFSAIVPLAKHTIAVVKEIQKGCCIFQTSAAIAPESFWIAVLQRGARIITAVLQLWERPQKDPDAQYW